MAELKGTDKFIVDRTGSTYKTSFEEIQNQIDINLLGDNVSLDPNDTVNMTFRIDDLNHNFGSSWDEATQKKGKIYTNIGVGAVDETWLYIGGSKRDATITLVPGGPNQIQAIEYDEQVETQLPVGPHTGTINDNGSGGTGGEALVTVEEFEITIGGDVDNPITETKTFITKVTPVTSGSSYTEGPADIEVTDGSTTETFEVQIRIAAESLQVGSVDTAGTGFVDGTFSDIIGVGAGLTLDLTTTNGEVTSGSVKYIGYGYSDGDTIKLVSPGSGQYGKDVNGYELTTWLGTAADANNAKPNEGWVILSSLSDDGGYVLRSGDEMFGTLSMLSAADPAIIAVNDITTESAVTGKTITGYESVNSSGTLGVNGKSTLSGGFIAGTSDVNGTSEVQQVLRVKNLAGYLSMNSDFDAVIVDDNGTEIPIDDKDFITKGYFDKNNTGGGGGTGYEYDLEVQSQANNQSEAVLTLKEDGVGKTDVTFEAGELIKLTTNDGNRSITIDSEATQVIFSANAPNLDVGKLWYNTTDGRLYVCYDDLGADSLLPRTTQWVDASPSAINGGDYVFKYGDIVNNFLRVQNDTTNDPSLSEATFFAQHYILDELKNIADAPPTVTP